MYRFCNVLASDAETAVAQPAASAVLLLDSMRRLVSASPGAEAAIGVSPLALQFGALAAREQSAARRLDAAFREIAETGGEVTLTLDEHKLQLVPLIAHDGTRQTIATLRRVRDDSGTRLRRAATRFGLTPAEARLLGALCGGASLGQASAHLGVARTTARTHLQRIFDKSGTHRQAELVGAVLAA
jgi:DNA-binding CsgD family transcriptional regulator